MIYGTNYDTHSALIFPKKEPRYFVSWDSPKAVTPDNRNDLCNALDGPGDGSVPTESALLFPLKWAFEFE